MGVPTHRKPFKIFMMRGQFKVHDGGTPTILPVPISESKPQDNLQIHEICCLDKGENDNEVSPKLWAVEFTSDPSMLGTAGEAQARAIPAVKYPNDTEVAAHNYTFII